MKFMFVDESEDKKLGVNYLVVGGVLVDGNALFGLSSQINDLKNEFDIKNLKEMRNTKKFSSNEKLKFTGELSHLLRDYKVKSINIVEVPNRTKIYNKGDVIKNKLYSHAISLLSERVTLNAYRNEYKWALVADTLIARREVLTGIKELISQVIRDQKAYSIHIGDYMFETPFFVEDNFSNFIQVADLIVLSINHAIRSYVTKNSLEHLYENKISAENLKGNSPYLDTYWQLMDHSPNGKVDAWGIKFWWYNEI